MLFNSYEFLLVFLPIALIGFYLLAEKKSRTLFLIIVSVFFYAYWDYRYVFLIIISALTNYYIGKSLSTKPRKYILTIGVILNLLLLNIYLIFIILLYLC